ncbi:MAG TPA: TolC family protein [Bryobacteraceae bacterium]|jgi:outer membrane protein TolC|nr:TolC family protein [Bryobacteraceae bacterium]
MLLFPWGVTAEEPVVQPARGGPLPFLTRQFRPARVSPPDFANSSRLGNLIRAGRIYLSLEDAIALALENNLDIASVRYDPLIARADFQRASSGGLTRGVPTTVTPGPSSAGPASTITASSVGVAASSGSGLSQLGPTVPSLDPMVTGRLSWGHTTAPQRNRINAGGLNYLITNATQNSIGISKNFITGGGASLTLSNALIFQNAGQNSLELNPSRQATLDLVMIQPLLQGFSPAVNRRYIRIAKNNLKIADFVFQEQVIATVSNIISLYWDLVGFNQAVKYAQDNLALADRTYSDNKRQADIGTLAPIEITRAEAEVASRRQDLVVAQTNVLQQESIIKNALSRNGLLDPVVREARIVPTDTIQIPKEESAADLASLFGEALANRLELKQSTLAVDNGRIQLQGTRKELLPQLGLFVELTNHGAAGFVNMNPPLAEGGANVDPYFIGGMSSAFGQVFRRNFPDYRIGFSLNIPFRNRAAQSDYVHDQLTLRQSELAYRKQENQIRVDVQNALVGLKQARAQYDAAVKQRILEEQTLDAEQKKNRLGANTIFDVIQAQRDLAQSESNEVTAQSAYVKARVNLEVATGRILSAYNINIEEARQGKISRPPSALPAVEKP